MIKLRLLLPALCFLTLTMTAQHKKFTLEDLIPGGKTYQQMSPTNRYYEWWGDELMQLEADRASIIDKESGKKDELFSLYDVKKICGGEDIFQQNGKSGYTRKLLSTVFPYPSEPVAVITTPSERIAIDFKAKELLWRQDVKGSLEWNSKSRTDAFSRDKNLWLRLQDGTERQLTTDGSRSIVYGESVHRNEFGIEKGTFFSPDGTKLAFYRMDQTIVTDYPQVNIFKPIAVCEPDKYPMAGTASHKVTIGIHNIQEDSTLWLDLGDPTDRYFTNISWSPDGTKIYLIELNRGQTISILDEYDATMGKKLRTLYTETDTKYTEPKHPISFLPWDSNKFVLWSARDGFWHLYLYDLSSGKCLKQLTKGDYVVLQLLGFSPSTKSIIVKANKENHVCHNLYSVNTETGEMVLADNGKGVHDAKLSYSGDYLLDAYSEPDLPQAYSLRNLTNQTVKAGKELYVSPNPWEGYAVPTYQHGTIKAADGKTDLHYRMTLPPDFSPEKKYPAVVYVYGGPQIRLVEASWLWGGGVGKTKWETYMAQKGYVVFVLDSRGSVHRGKDFEQATFHQLGQVEMLDQMKGVDFLKSLKYIDTSRLGVFGWSYGGYMTISLMTNYPKMFKVGVAGGPVVDWKGYEVMYTERYMGTPESNPEGYEKTSLLNKAKNLKGRLQIIIGSNDPVVVPQHAYQFINACNLAGTQPDFYIYPGSEHNVVGQQCPHLFQRITRYFEDFLK